MRLIRRSYDDLLSRISAVIAIAMLLSLAAFVAPARALAAEPAVPKLSSPVTDLTGSLSPEQRSALEAASIGLEREKGAQVVVLVVETTAGESIESYALRVAEANRLGRTKTNDGVLLLIARNDRAARIEVGYALEGALPDAICKRILEEQIFPLFRAGSFYEGIAAGMNAIAARVRGESLPPPVNAPGQRTSPAKSQLFFVGVFLALGLAGALKSVVGDFGAATVGALLCGVVGLIVQGIALAVLFAVVGFVLVLFGAIQPHRGIGYYGGGGWSGGRGGGWSGGGGSFGGGGASGRW